MTVDVHPDGEGRQGIVRPQTTSNSAGLSMESRHVGTICCIAIFAILTR